MTYEIQNKTAKFIANTEENVVEITQLKTEVITKVDIGNLLTVLKTDISQTGKTSLYCSKAKMEITLGSNFHLRTSLNSVNTYLTKGFDQQLLSYIETMFPNIDKVDKILSISEQKTHIPKKEELSKEKKTKKIPIIKMEEYFEPNYDDANCNGYPNINFIGIKGNHGETVEISFKAHEDLFDPYGGINKNYLVGNGFNLYDNNRKNLAYENNIGLICTHNKSEATFKIKLISTIDRKYFGTKIKKHQPITIVNGRLPEPIKYKSYMSQLIDDEPIQTEVSMTNNADEELPW